MAGYTFPVPGGGPSKPSEQPKWDPAQFRVDLCAKIAGSMDREPDDPLGWFSNIAKQYGVSLETVQHLAFEPEDTLLCGVCRGAAGHACAVCKGRGWARRPRSA